jgi:hypothetical protein
MPEETFGQKAGNKLQEGLEQVKSSVKDLAEKAGIGSDDDVGPAGGSEWGARTRTASSAGRSHGRSAATQARSGVTRAKGAAKGTAARAKTTGKSTAARAKTTGKSTATHAKSGAIRTRDELYADAARLGIKGRSKMTKAELEKAVRRG